jgi:DNA-directed RNA polymerase subunit alpha
VFNHDLHSPQFKVEHSEQTYGKFIIEPLEAGFGHTLGNPLRRVLLSSLPGAAVTAIKINGVNHEFQDIPHVREDVTEIVLNIKRLRLRCHSDSPVEMSLDVVGEREVTAADIQAPSTVEIVTPDLHIATLDGADARLGMTLVVERGKGYRPVDPNEDQPIGQIPIDSIFTPIYKVNYTVKNTRVGQMTDYDRIEMEVWSDGTISPEEAMRDGAHILVEQFSFVSNYRISPAEETVATGGPTLSNVPIPAHIYNTPIEDLNLSMRAYNCLRRSNIKLVGQVLTMSMEDLLAVRNFGEKSLGELREKLIERRFLPNLPDDIGGYDMDDDQALED